MCVDYRQVNDVTIKNKYPIPIIELIDELPGATILPILDVRLCYYQIRVCPEDIYTHKTAFPTHNGLYEFLIMSFGFPMRRLHFNHL